MPDAAWHDFLVRLEARLSLIAARYGIIAAVAIALPAVVYLGSESGLTIARSGTAAPAVRAVLTVPDAANGDPAPSRMMTPAFVKGIYVTAAAVGSKKKFERLVDLVGATELNSMVIDVKGGNGSIAFNAQNDGLKPYVEPNPPLGDLPALTKRLHDKGVYLIARISVFEDPWYAARRPEFAVRRAGGGLWRNRKGTLWLDAAAKEVWKYNAAIAREAWAGGFDEVQFDYVRFPSDGDIGAIRYPVYDGKKSKAEVMADFFSYLDTELRIKRNIVISADLFGLTMWNPENDMGIGQKLSLLAPHMDFVSPMVYPSHYSPGFGGYANPALYPYEVVYKNLVRGQKTIDELNKNMETLRTRNPSADLPDIAKVRPWIQDFNLGARYTAEMVRAQMKASVDAGAAGWMIWNAGNVYTADALLAL